MRGKLKHNVINCLFAQLQFEFIEIFVINFFKKCLRFFINIQMQRFSLKIS